MVIVPSVKMKIILIVLLSVDNWFDDNWEGSLVMCDIIKITKTKTVRAYRYNR